MSRFKWFVHQTTNVLLLLNLLTFLCCPSSICLGLSYWSLKFMADKALSLEVSRLQNLHHEGQKKDGRLDNIPTVSPRIAQVSSEKVSGRSTGMMTRKCSRESAAETNDNILLLFRLTALLPWLMHWQKTCLRKLCLVRILHIFIRYHLDLLSFYSKAVRFYMCVLYWLFWMTMPARML